MPAVDPSGHTPVRLGDVGFVGSGDNTDFDTFLLILY